MAGPCQTEGEARENDCSVSSPSGHLRRHLPLAGEDCGIRRPVAHYATNVSPLPRRNSSHHGLPSGHVQPPPPTTPRRPRAGDFDDDDRPRGAGRPARHHDRPGRHRDPGGRANRAGRTRAWPGAPPDPRHAADPRRHRDPGARRADDRPAERHARPPSYSRARALRQSPPRIVRPRNAKRAERPTTEAPTRERAATRTTPEPTTRQRASAVEPTRPPASTEPSPVAAPTPEPAPQSPPAPDPGHRSGAAAHRVRAGNDASPNPGIHALDAGKGQRDAAVAFADGHCRGSRRAVGAPPQAAQPPVRERRTRSLCRADSAARCREAGRCPAYCTQPVAPKPVVSEPAEIPAAVTPATASAVAPVAAVPMAAPKFLEPRGKAPPTPPVAARARLTCELRPLRAGLNLLSATVECELVVTNTGTASAEAIRTGVALLTAHADQDQDLAQFNAAPVVRPVAPPFALAPGETRTIRTVDGDRARGDPDDDRRQPADVRARRRDQHPVRDGWRRGADRARVGGGHRARRLRQARAVLARRPARCTRRSPPGRTRRSSNADWLAVTTRARADADTIDVYR